MKTTFQNKREGFKSEPIKKPKLKPIKVQESGVCLTDEQLQLYGLIPEFKSRSSFLKFFQKKQLDKYMDYLNGVKWIVDSITLHGYEVFTIFLIFFQVAKHFFLNPVEWTCFSQYSKTSESSQKEVTPFDQDNHAKDGYKFSKIHYWNEQKIKINDLQNFVFQSMKWLLQNYAEYGAETELIETTLIQILQKQKNMLESK